MEVGVNVEVEVNVEVGVNVGVNVCVGGGTDVRVDVGKITIGGGKEAVGVSVLVAVTIVVGEATVGDVVAVRVNVPVTVGTNEAVPCAVEVCSAAAVAANIARVSVRTGAGCVGRSKRIPMRSKEGC